MPDGRGTELQEASVPNLDRIAAEGICGLHEPVGVGITPGSGPGHLALFGYDPRLYRVGRGVLTAEGIGFELREGDVAARGNFCTLDHEGRVVDRRAGRIDTMASRHLCQRLAAANMTGVELFVEPVAEHRFLLVLRGEGLDPGVSDTDPGRPGSAPDPPEPLNPGAARTADYVSHFVEQARETLKDEPKANGVVLRGFGARPEWPGMKERYGLKSAALASYPMYRGVARLVGMRVYEAVGEFGDNISVLSSEWGRADFWFLHEKGLDSAGEDGDFGRRVERLEALDALLPRLLGLEPDVFIVTGDHSTPARLGRHSWHTVPAVLLSPSCRPDTVRGFDE
jgi:2,3-bisphosphoglycerate-independent phosphoglycerate mutase